MAEQIVVEIKGDKIFVKTPYDVFFIKKVKEIFVESEREYDESQKAWLIKYTPENHQLIEKMVQEHFGNVQEKLAIFKCNGDAPAVNHMYLVSYTRDSSGKRRAWCFDTIIYERMGHHGSRRSPLFYGIVLAKVLVNKNTRISADEYKLYPYSKSLHMTALELVKSAESLDDYEKIVEKLDSVAQELSKAESVAIKAKEAVAVNGFLVVSSLPSKALLDEILPKEYKGERIGSEIIQLIKGYFYNKIGVLSRKFYNDILQKHGVWAGFGYIVPKHRVQEFIKEIEELREEYKKFEEQLRAFLERGEIAEELREGIERGRIKIYQEYIDVVREYLKERGVTEIKVPEISERVKIRLVPFTIDMEIVSKYLEERAIQDVQKELEIVKQEMFQNLREQLEEKINSIFERIKNYEAKNLSKKVIKKLREDMNYVVKTAEELGIQVERLDILRKAVETIDEEKIEPTVAEGRLKALLAELSS